MAFYSDLTIPTTARYLELYSTTMHIRPTHSKCNLISLTIYKEVFFVYSRSDWSNVFPCLTKCTHFLVTS
ncbi:hypothetical protein B0T26DRAFT_712275 [Lasiosphaeria miniovina]|uniref:Uncharacterized protein n=1 Tax=Lasiosphaeria miniovina TaxID=1954250 RepID=A0AA40ALS0_9PEZI|nr:uncharacterized protein B0T26DRAFT_712275 [Lasiosphaeria miniovina]KAK0718196.1 hypothetical protein B0T26DRAFT_712275 [Lasiosphaeria miniovina]